MIEQIAEDIHNRWEAWEHAVLYWESPSVLLRLLVAKRHLTEGKGREAGRGRRGEALTLMIK